MGIERTLRGVLGMAGLGLVAITGCATSHGDRGGDPLLGNFNRPIAPTPQPYSGGYGAGSPAYDGGSRMGLPSPDVMVPAGSVSDNPASRTSWSMPAPVTPGAVDYSTTSGEKGRSATEKLFTPAYRKPNSVDGAKLQGMEQAPALVPMRPSTDSYPVGNATALRPSAPVNGMINGSSLPPEMQYSALRLVPGQNEQSRIQTVEEGQMILAGYGLKWQSLQQSDSGEWQYAAVVSADVNGTSYRRYDARHGNPVEAVKAVVEQAKRDR